MHIVPIELSTCLALLKMHVMYCALRIGFMDDMVIGCMVAPFLLILVSMYYFYD
jgi:hypothetical protein